LSNEELKVEWAWLEETRTRVQGGRGHLLKTRDEKINTKARDKHKEAYIQGLF